MWIVWTAIGVIFLLAMTLGICFWMTFWVPVRKPSKQEFEIPPGRVYEPYRDTMIRWMKETRELPSQEVSITSFDGLTLYGKYYECEPGAPMEIMFHGYRGTSERDLCGGVQRAFALGRNVLIVDQRASGKSEGHVISFGVNESRDCVSWVAFAVERFGADVQIILTGISMGAATVMMAAGKPLPRNVVGLLADCGYTSAKEIIQKVIRERHLPPCVMYPFIKWSARLFGGFDLEEAPPLVTLELNLKEIKAIL